MAKKKITRRSFVLLAGASGVGALLLRPGTRLGEKLIPYINPPDYPNPGNWAFYSTTCRECPAGCGLLMWHRDGRVTKAEGNPFHPVNKGRVCVRGQSSVQGEYDRNRIKQVLQRDENGVLRESSWNTALNSIRELLKNKKLILVSDLQTGSLAGVIENFAAAHSVKPVFYEAFDYDSLRLAGKEVYGNDLIPKIDISHSDLILSFNADLLETWLSPVEYTGEFSNMHSSDNGPGRFIYFGSSENLTAANADNFIITAPGTQEIIIYSIARKLKEKGAIRNKRFEGFVKNDIPRTATGIDESIIDDLVEKIIVAKAPVVLAGRGNDGSPDGLGTVKAAYLLNELLGNTARIDFTRHHALSGAAHKKDVLELFRSITDNHILIILNANPAYTESGFAEYIKMAGGVVYIGSSSNETSDLAQWVLPSHYSLEDWGDYEPWKGTVSLMQPVMKPLYDSKSSGDIFLELDNNKTEKDTFKKVVLQNWKKWSRGESKEALEEAIRSSHLIRETPEIKTSFSEFRFKENRNPEPQSSDFYLDPVPSLFFYDGRLANRPWLQEIPDPVSNIAWQNRVDLNSATAASMHIRNGELIKITSPSGTARASVRLTNKISANAIAIGTGQGHWSFGSTANGRGINVFSILAHDYSGPLPLVSIEKTGTIQMPLYLNITQDQHGRELLKYIPSGELKGISGKKEVITMPLPEGYSRERDLYKPHKHKDHRWAMVIDLQRCIGCKSCVAACYAENNIPVVGRENCERGLEMSWLKVPPYQIAKDRIAFIPVPCQHCDAAPCEPVCPVYAASHTDEGLNAQIYNRCVGTRYCSNNCPYKVRRFNWKNIEHYYPGNLQLNPEVTVRSRGVMEKCTFCVQRIRNVEYSAKKDERLIEDGEIVPACAQTCPAEAIVFGDLLDPKAQVSRLFNHERRYQLLRELNTKPAVVYLKKILLV